LKELQDKRNEYLRQINGSDNTEGLEDRFFSICTIMKLFMATRANGYDISIDIKRIRKIMLIV
jgi:hypothetical protein